MMITRASMRTFVAAGAWAIIPAALYLLAYSRWSAFLLLLPGLALGFLVIQPQHLKPGEYPRFQLALLVLAGLGMVGLALFMFVLVRGDARIGWVVYIAGTLTLLAISTAQVARDRTDHSPG